MKDISLEELEQIQKLIVEPVVGTLTARINELLAVIRTLHTEESCIKAAELNTALKTLEKKMTEADIEIHNTIHGLTKQQDRWLGGIAVLMAIGGITLAFKDSIIDFIRGGR